MKSKLEDAEREVKHLRRQKHLMKTALKEQSLYMKDNIRMLNKVKQRTDRFMKELINKHETKFTRIKSRSFEIPEECEKYKSLSIFKRIWSTQKSL